MPNNATFGVNIIPKDNTVTLGNSNSPWSIVSPSLTGVPTAPTAAADTNNNQIATTAFVKAQWSVSSGCRIYTRQFTITNTSGSYTHIFEDENFASDMEAIHLEVNNENVFGATIYFTCGEGQVTIECANVSGTDTITVSFVKAVDEDGTMTSVEFTILNNRLTQIEHVESNNSITIQPADWTLSSGVYTYTYTNSRITTNTSIEVELLNDDVQSIDSMEYEKVSGVVKLTVERIPEEDVAVNIKITNAAAKFVEDLQAEDVATDVVTGASNVEEALEKHNDAINALSSNWEEETVTGAPTGTTVICYKNVALKLAVIYFNAENTSADNTVLTFSTIVSAATITSGMRGNGYISVFNNNNRCFVSYYSQNQMGNVMFPIK